MPNSERTPARRLRILTWQVHGNYLHYLSHVPHDFFLVVRPGHPPHYAGRVGHLPWRPNVHEMPESEVAQADFDCILYQHRQQYEQDRLRLLTPTQQRLPAIYLEHDPPQEHPTATRHIVQDRNVLLVHVTDFNALMWDNAGVPSCVIEHGVPEPQARYRGTRERGIAVINNLARRGRRLGADLFEQARQQLPIDLVGMDAQTSGGIGEIPNDRLAAFCADYRFYFHPIRYTSLGLAMIEAMMIGMPVVALATTEVATLIRTGHNGIAELRPERLIDGMSALLRDRALAVELGEQGRSTALQRFGIGRFVDDWLEAFCRACD